MSDLVEYELRPLALPECELVASWADSPEEGLALGVTEEFPLTADTVAAWTYEVDYAFTLRRQGDLAAYGEITEDPVEQDVEISRILVAPDMRGRGVGRALLRGVSGRSPALFGSLAACPARRRGADCLCPVGGV